MNALSFIFCSPLGVKGICHSHADRLQKDSDSPGENAELCDHPSNPKTTEEGEQGRVHPGLSGDCWNHPQPTCHYYCLHLYFYLTVDADKRDLTFHRGRIPSQTLDQRWDVLQPVYYLTDIWTLLNYVVNQPVQSCLLDTTHWWTVISTINYSYVYSLNTVTQLHKLCSSWSL